MKPLALITGVGPGTGASVARRFAAAGYRTALLARNENRLNELASELPDSNAFVCDVTDSEALAQVVEAAGPVDVVVHNAVGGGWGTFSEIEPEMLENNFQVNVMALLHLARLTTPSMVQAGKGALIVTGNTGLRQPPSIRYLADSQFKMVRGTRSTQRIEDLGINTGKLLGFKF